MRISSSLVAVFALLLSPSLAAHLSHLRVSIPASPGLANPNTLPPSTTSTLSTLSRTYTSSLRADNSFDFRNVSAGSYLLSVNCASHAFKPLRVDVHPWSDDMGTKLVEAWGTWRGNEWDNKGEQEAVTIFTPEAGEGEWIYSFEAKAAGEKQYYQERQGCKLLFNSLLCSVE